MDRAKKVLISGASGFIGSNLKKYLLNSGYEVFSLVRREPANNFEIFWDPESFDLDPSQISGFGTIINLSGESIVGRWSEKKKAKILSSRIQSAKLLVDAVLRSQSRPSTIISASAIGYYGDTESDRADETFPKGSGFLSDVAHAWESAFDPLRSSGVYLVHARFGIVLSPLGGALKAMLTPFKLGLGGPLGDGKAMMSWISLDDALGAIVHCMTHSLSGPVNFTAPNPVTNEEFSKTLSRSLRRPCLFRVPEFALKILFGEFATEGLLKSIGACPKTLLDSGYAFKHDALEAYLNKILA